MKQIFIYKNKKTSEMRFSPTPIDEKDFDFFERFVGFESFELQRMLLSKSVALLKQTKADFAPETTDSVVDVFLKEYDLAQEALQI